jgi:sarcosine oxidase subunit gamma
VREHSDTSRDPGPTSAHRLKPLPALGGDRPRVEDISGLRIAEVVDSALASLSCRRGRDAEFATVAERVFGFALPGPARAVAGMPYGAVWTGPEQWFIEAPFASHEDIARSLKGEFKDLASITEQTDGWVRFDVTGKGALDLFERLCPLDVRGMEDNAASRTLIEHLGCIVICRKAGVEFSVLGPRSAAGSLHHALIAAARSAL